MFVMPWMVVSRELGPEKHTWLIAGSQAMSATSGDAAMKNHVLYCLVRVLGVSAGHSWLHRLTAGGNNEETGEIIPLHPSNPSSVLESCLAIASPSLFPPPS